MKIYSEKSISNFEFWSGARENAKELTDEQFDELESQLEQLYPDGMSETELNDLLWFDFETVCDWLGIENETDEDKNE